MENPKVQTTVVDISRVTSGSSQVSMSRWDRQVNEQVTMSAYYTENHSQALLNLLQ